jgi:uncharacterized membrane protein
MQKVTLLSFIVGTCFVLGFGLQLFFSSTPSDMLSLLSVVMAVPALLFIPHFVSSLGIKRSIIFVFLAMGVGWFMETLGLMTGVVFGGHYEYSSSFLKIGLVPLAVVIYWVIFIYMGYSITSSFLYWLQKPKPARSGKGKWWALILLILLDGWFITAIDLFMDPIQVKLGSWQWLEGGHYFGVPVGNFIGWFLVSIMVSGIFRTVEYFFPRKNINRDFLLHVVPIVGYAVTAILLALFAVKFNLFTLVVVGLMVMAPAFIIQGLIFIKARYSP